MRGGQRSDAAQNSAPRNLAVRMGLGVQSCRRPLGLGGELGGRGHLVSEQGQRPSGISDVGRCAHSSQSLWKAKSGHPHTLRGRPPWSPRPLHGAPGRG